MVLSYFGDYDFFSVLRNAIEFHMHQPFKGIIPERNYTFYSDEVAQEI